VREERVPIVFLTGNDPIKLGLVTSSTVNPILLAVLMLTTVSYLGGACIGGLAVFSPRRIRLTWNTASL
jgi:hypothetical protein